MKILLAVFLAIVSTIITTLIVILTYHPITKCVDLDCFGGLIYAAYAVLISLPIYLTTYILLIRTKESNLILLPFILTAGLFCLLPLLFILFFLFG